jgi:hypothetical protein
MGRLYNMRVGRRGNPSFNNPCHSKRRYYDCFRGEKMVKTNRFE